VSGVVSLEECTFSNCAYESGLIQIDGGEEDIELTVVGTCFVKGTDTSVLMIENDVPVKIQINETSFNGYSVTSDGVELDLLAWSNGVSQQTPEDAATLLLSACNVSENRGLESFLSLQRNRGRLCVISRCWFTGNTAKRVIDFASNTLATVNIAQTYFDHSGSSVLFYVTLASTIRIRECGFGSLVGATALVSGTGSGTWIVVDCSFDQNYQVSPFSAVPGSVTATVQNSIIVPTQATFPSFTMNGWLYDHSQFCNIFRTPSQSPTATGSIPFAPTRPFTASGDLTPSGKFMASDYFAPSRTFAPSGSFTASDEFRGSSPWVEIITLSAAFAAGSVLGTFLVTIGITAVVFVVIGRRLIYKADNYLWIET
jgi:hypothetical protein